MSANATKLIFLDIDGTLLGDGYYIPESAVQACRKARAGGHLLYISSGRALAEIGPMILDIGFDGIVSGGGARIDDTAQGITLFQARLESDLVRRLVRFLNDNEKPCVVEMGDHVLINSYFKPYLKILRSLTNDDQLSLFRTFLDSEKDFISDEVEKIVFSGGGLTFDEIAAQFSHECEIFRGSISAFGPECGEISPPGVHKGAALEIVARHHNIPVSDTIAIGDSDNDRTMIASAGLGIAMGNAVESIKKIAGFVTSRLEEDGIAHAFQKAGIIA